MIVKKTIMSGFVSGALLVASSVFTPASANHVSLNLNLAFDDPQIESIDTSNNARSVGKVYKVRDRRGRRHQYQDNSGYRDIPYREIRRKLRRRGLFPVSKFRLRRDVVIVRAEDDYGTLFRVVADAYYGDIIRVRRIRAKQYRPPAPPVVVPDYSNDWDEYRPNRRFRAQDRRVRPNPPVRQRALTRAEKRARTKALKRGDQRRRAAQAAADQRRRNAQALADQRRRANQAAADNRRRAAQAAADKRRRAGKGRKKKLPYIDGNPEQTEMRNYGSGR